MSPHPGDHAVFFDPPGVSFGAASLVVRLADLASCLAAFGAVTTTLASRALLAGAGSLVDVASGHPFHLIMVCEHMLDPARCRDPGILKPESLHRGTNRDVHSYEAYHRFLQAYAKNKSPQRDDLFNNVGADERT